MVKPIYLKAETIRDEIEPLSLCSFNILLEGSIYLGQERALPFYIVEDSRNGRERNGMKEEEGERKEEEEREKEEGEVVAAAMTQQWMRTVATPHPQYCSCDEIYTSCLTLT